MKLFFILYILCITYVKIGVIFCNDKLGLWFVLTVHHVHVESSLLWKHGSPSQSVGHEKTEKFSPFNLNKLTCLMKSSGRCSWSSTHFSSSPTKKLTKEKKKEVIDAFIIEQFSHLSGSHDSLPVPVVDLVNVPKDDFILSFHVVGNALLLDPLHEALQGHRMLLCGCEKPTYSIWVGLSVEPMKDEEDDTAQMAAGPFLSHLHHQAQVFDIVLLRLNQLIQNKPAQEKENISLLSNSICCCCCTFT